MFEQGIEFEYSLLYYIEVYDFRRGHTVLQAALPPKQEYVFLIRMSPLQKRLYNAFMESISESGQNGWVNNNPLKAFSVCCKVNEQI